MTTTLPLVGRADDEEWFQAHLRLDPAEDPRGRVLLVSGEAGIGKTHLLSHVIPRDRILSTIAFPQARFAAPGSGLRQLTQIGGSAAEALRAELEETDAADGGWKLISICRAADHLLASHPGTVVVFDDLQWMDELTLAWLSRSSDLLMNTPVAVVLAVRAPGALPLRVLDATAPLRRAGLLDSRVLEPFSVGDVAELAANFGYELSDSVARRLHHRTDGLPLAVEELLRERARRGTTLRTTQVLDPIAGSSSVPVLTAVVREQVAGLEADPLELLSVVALMPQPASEAIARSITGFVDDRFNSALEETLASGFLVRSGVSGLRFRHELQREVFQEHMGVRQRRSLHRRIAHVLVKTLQYPAAEIANQFAGAGLIAEAREWLERASIEASRAHDHGNALSHLAAALDLCPEEEVEVRTRLAERVVVAARSSNQPAAGIELVERSLAVTTSSEHRGRMLLCLSRLVSFFGDYESRVAALNEAREAFSSAGDMTGLARALGEMALPVGKSPSITRRIELGREGLALAEAARDPSAIGLCAANLAVAELRSGNRGAFDLWARAASVEAPSSEYGEEAVRNRTNWAIGALDYGLYPEAEKVLREGARLWANPFWKEFFHCMSAMALWRTGRWDEAAEEAMRAQTGISRPEVAATSTAILAAIGFERDPRPEITPLAAAVGSLISLSDEQWGSVAQSILMRIRAARREPQPERGLSSLVQLIVTTGVRIGWDDLLPAIAEVNPALCRQTLAVLGDVRPVGERADASLVYMEGLLALDQPTGDAEESFGDAADLYGSLPDPYFMAKALEGAAEARARLGKRAGELLVRAAEIYSDLRADRSLARLLRRHRTLRALDGFRIPSSQLHARAPGLTRREWEVADLARQGYTARAIGEILGISPVTAKKHLERVKTKLAVERKSDLVRLLSLEAPPVLMGDGQAV